MEKCCLPGMCQPMNTNAVTCCALRGRCRRIYLPKWASSIGLIVGMLGLIAWWLPDQWGASLRFTLENLLSISPFLLLSASLAAYLQASNADSVIGRALTAKRYQAIGLAALIGTLSPFCSCGVVPLITALLLARVPLSAIMAFWIASPIMSPSMFVMTVAGLGLEFAVVKTLAAMGLGLLAGLLTQALQSAGWFKSFLKLDALVDDKLPPIKQVNWKIWHEPERVARFGKKTIAMTGFLLKWLSVAFILESLMLRYLPAEVLSQWLGADSKWAIPMAALIGVPAYLNGFAAIPVVAGLIHNGMAWGAALTFMLAGAVTSLPAAIAVYSIVKFRLFIWYIALALFGAALMGWLYQMVLGFLA